MYKIKWRTLNHRRFIVLNGLSRYTTFEGAQKQVDIWLKFFPNNQYWIEKT